MIYTILVYYPSGKKEIFRIEAKSEDEAYAIALKRMDKIVKKLNENKKFEQN